MKIIFKENVSKRVNDITNKELSNIKVFKEEELLADLYSSKELKEGIYKVNVVIEYTDESRDTIENQKIYMYTKDVKLTLNYKSVGTILAALMSSPMFWVGCVLTLALGIGVIIILLAFILADKSRYYKKKGPSIMHLTEK